MASYLLQEDGVGKFTLENASGFILLEDGTAPVVPVQPSGVQLRPVIPRRVLDKRRRRGRLKWPLARIDVYAPTPILRSSLETRATVLHAHAGQIRTTLRFALKPAQALASYTKGRSIEREIQIRKALIADLFNRDDGR